MKLTHAKRKLLDKPLLITLHKKAVMGVPVAALIREYSLAISRPALITLLQHYKYFLTFEPSNEDYSKCHDSLFPPWWGCELGFLVRENPDNWAYQGAFPLGEWVKDEDN